MVDKRLKNFDWAPGNDQGNAPTWERVNTAILLDIRDELQALNGLLRCPNFTGIPASLRQIRLNTRKEKRKVKK